MKRMLALVVVMVMGFGAVGAEPVKTLEIGAKAPAFDLPGVDGKNHKLADFAAAKVLVVLFTSNHCPTAQAYEDRVLRMHTDYKVKGVQLVAIQPNDPLAVRLDELGYTDLGDSLARFVTQSAARQLELLEGARATGDHLVAEELAVELEEGLADGPPRARATAVRAEIASEAGAGAVLEAQRALREL